MKHSLAQKYFHEARALEKRGLLEYAIHHYTKAIEAEPSCIDAHYHAALLYQQTQQYEEALSSLKKVTELDPEDASAYNNLGVVYFSLSLFEEAKESFEKALSIDTHYLEPRNNLQKVREKFREIQHASSSATSIKTYQKSIGFVTLWHERGHAYVTKAIRDALAKDYNTFVFARNGGSVETPLLETTGEWYVPNLTPYGEYRIPRVVLENWITQNKLDVVFFNEEYDFNLVDEAKKNGTKTIGYYVWELFNPEFVAECNRLYDKIICPTKACYNRFKSLGLDHIEYIKWGMDSNLFTPINRPANKKVRFFHPSGLRGLHARRGTQFVIDAFQRLKVPDAELVIHKQNGTGSQKIHNITTTYGTLPREELVRMYQNADIAVLPSKWEGLGLTFLESIGCGLPIITVDAPPMNEFVRNGETGFLCRVAKNKKYQDIFVDGVYVDTVDMAEKMHILAEDSVLRRRMRENSIAMALKHWDQESFQLRIQKLFNSVLPSGFAFNTSNKRLQLTSKDYTNHRLIRQDDGRLFIQRDNVLEPFTVHFVGARWSNHPWGMENEIHRILEKLGVTIIDTDFRKDFHHLSGLLKKEAHILFVVKGNGIPPDLIQGQGCLNILWYQDDVFATEHASQHIAYNGHAFDIVYSFDKMAIEQYRRLGVKDPRWLPLAMSPEVHHKKFLMDKVYDVSFIGNIYPNRKALLEKLRERFHLLITRAYMDKMVEIFNKSKIILNLGIGPTGIQSRVFEVLGSGSFLLTNEIPSESRLFEDRKHLVYFNSDNIEELIAYYLTHDEERETIALAGYREAHNRHTYHHRIVQILCDVFKTGTAQDILTVK